MKHRPYPKKLSDTSAPPTGYALVPGECRVGHDAQPVRGAPPLKDLPARNRQISHPLTSKPRPVGATPLNHLGAYQPGCRPVRPGPGRNDIDPRRTTGNHTYSTVMSSGPGSDS